MGEFAEVTRSSFRIQERPDWYKINSFLVEVGEASTKLGLAKEDLVQIGGTSFFYHAYKAFGPQVVPNFRGTHDMDIVSFNLGTMQRVLDSLTADDKSQVVNYITAGSFLPNKRR